jgi:hypothetical protein
VERAEHSQRLVNGRGRRFNSRFHLVDASQDARRNWRQKVMLQYIPLNFAILSHPVNWLSVAVLVGLGIAGLGLLETQLSKGATPEKKG